MEKKENPFVGVVCSGDTKEAYVFAEELFEICKGKKVKVILDAFSLIQRENKGKQYILNKAGIFICSSRRSTPRRHAQQWICSSHPQNLP